MVCVASLIETYRSLSDTELDFVERQLDYCTFIKDTGLRLYAIDKVRKEREEKKEK